MLFSPLTLTLSPKGRGGDEYAAPSVLNDGPLPQGERGDEYAAPSVLNDGPLTKGRGGDEF